MTPIQQPLLDPQAAVAEVNQRFMSSFAGQDAAGISELYTEGGQVLPPGADIIQGKAEIQRFWQGVMDLGIRRAQLETIEVEFRGSTAVEVGRYVLHGENGVELDRGKYVVVWQDQGNQWKLHRDIWNSSAPPAES